MTVGEAAVGKKFHALTILKYLGGGTVLCKCDCSKNTVSDIYRIRSGNTKSCGCYRKANSSGRTHGESGTLTFKTWNHMMARCHTKSNTAYVNYGGRGIYVCSRWRKSYLNFKKDMGERVSAAMTIDRIDNAKGYSPDNCRWASMKQQRANQTRKIILFEHQGKKQLLRKWANELGLNYSTLYARIYAGMSFKDAIEKPIISKPRNRDKGEKR